MCGIAGYTGPSVPGKLRAMADSLLHRGPDEEGFFDSDNIHMCMKRLAIVDLKTGKQPQYNASRSLVVMFNGEIYNYRELRKDLTRTGYKFETESSDTEVIVHLYDHYGINFVSKLFGMFAIALYDKKKDQLILIRDRMGKKPIYYSLNSETGNFQFASEFNSLIRGTNFSKSNIDSESLAWYFSQKTTPQHSSIHSRIKKIPPSHYLIFRNGKIKIRRYYDFIQQRRLRKITPARATDKLEELINDAVTLRMRADVEVGAFLSGGIDSSLCVAMASKMTSVPIQTYCLIYDEKIYNKDQDRRFAAKVSKLYKTSHNEIVLTPEKLAAQLPDIVRHHGQPNSAVISNWFVSQVMGQKVKVAISGDGADELFGSYFLHRAMSLKEKNAKPAFHMKQEIEFIKTNGNRPFYEIIDKFGVFTDEEMTKLFNPGSYRKGNILKLIKIRERLLKTKGPLSRSLEFDCRNLLVEQILNYADLLSMAHSLEVRTPFLDHRIVEFAFSLPSEFKIKKGEIKWILKQVAERWLPKELVYRKKEGFVEPAIHWLGKELREFCLSYLESPEFNRLSLLNLSYVEELKRKFYSSHDFFVGKKIWSLLIFALWERHCIEGNE